MRAQQAGETPIAEGETVTFDASDRARLEDMIPLSGEQSAVTAGAQAVGALAAHADGGGCLCDAVGAAKRVEEAELALGRPAVPSASLRSDATDLRGLR